MYFWLCAAKQGLPAERWKASSLGTECGLSGRRTPAFPFYIIMPFPVFEEKAVLMAVLFLLKSSMLPGLNASCNSMLAML